MDVSVHTYAGDKRVKFLGEELADALGEFVIHSPLMRKAKVAEEQVYDNIALLWAVLHCAKKNSSNMLLCQRLFQDDGFTMKDSPSPKLKRGVQFVVEMPILSNEHPIAAGDLLTFHKALEEERFFPVQSGASLGYVACTYAARSLGFGVGCMQHL